MREFMTGLFVSAAFAVYAQPSYQLPEFIIFPEEQTVCNWLFPGTDYIPDRRVNYSTTELVCIARGITFKEYVRDFDLNTFKVLRHSADPYTDMLFVDKNGLYRDFYPDESGYRSMESLSGKAMLAERIYIDKNDRTIYFVDVLGDELIELENIPQGFDFKTLQPVCDNFFFNKDGLYVFGYVYAESPYYTGDSSVNLLKKNKGKQILPKVYKHYFEYGGEVYARNQSDVVIKLDLNPGNIIDLSNIIHPEFLTDGKTAYSGFYKTSSEGLERVVNWETIAENGEFIFTIDKQTNRVFMPSDVSVPVYDMDLTESALVWDGEKYLSIDCEGSMQTFKKLFVYNYKTKKHEELNRKKYKRLARGLYLYDGLLIRDGNLVEGQEVLKVNKLRQLLLDFGEAPFFTDGKYIYCMDAENTIVEGVDINTLRAINNQLLIDKNRIYSFNAAELSIIPYRELGLNLRVCEQE